MLLALAAFICLVGPASAQAVTAGGAISGTVTDEVSGEPIANLEVCAFSLREEEEEEWRCSETDEAGEYEISDLTAGEWGVEFSGRPLGYVIQYWEDKAHWYEADPVVVESEPVTGIDAQLVRGGEIQGTVKAATGGAPIGEVEVCAWGYPGELFAGCTQTNSEGKYALAGLAAAEYEIGFYPWEGNFVNQYYDHEANWWESDLVPVAEGEVVTGIDADLETGATISGTVYSNATGAPLAEIVVCSIEVESGELWNCTQTEGSGRYTLERLAAGSYKVVFSIDFEEWYEEEFGEEEDDGYPTEFWNQQTTLAAANVISLTTGQATSGIDARLGPPASQPSLSGSGSAPVLGPPPVRLPVPVRKRCRKGFRRKKVKGGSRCVRRKKHPHRRHAGSSASAAALPPAVRPLFAR